MARHLTTPKDPEALGLAVLALRHYVDPVAAPTPFEANVASSLKTLRVGNRARGTNDRAFRRHPSQHRERFLGRTYDAAARPPRT